MSTYLRVMIFCRPYYMLIVNLWFDFCSIFIFPLTRLSTNKLPAGKFFSLLVLCMFVPVLFISICKILILFVVMHVFFLIVVIFSYWFFISIFASFLFSRTIDEEASNRQVFFPFAVTHVCFITICLYLQGFIFVCCYTCFFS